MALLPAPPGALFAFLCSPPGWHLLLALLTLEHLSLPPGSLLRMPRLTLMALLRAPTVSSQSSE